MRGNLTGRGRPSEAGGAAAIDVNKVVARPHITHQFRRLQVDLAVYPFIQPMAFEADIPFIVAVHDLQHRLQPGVPEVSANGEWEWREYLYRNGTPSATLILADSEVGKEDILHCYGPYGVTPDRVKVLPFLAASPLGSHVSEADLQRVRTATSCPSAICSTRLSSGPPRTTHESSRRSASSGHEHRLEIPIVFCGSHAGELREPTFQEVMSSAARLGIERQIRYTGYVPDEDMAALYAGAAALVMPTFFGPTNIPVIEALGHGCPVLTSDIRGIREQVGDPGRSSLDRVDCRRHLQALDRSKPVTGAGPPGASAAGRVHGRLSGAPGRHLEEASLRARPPQRLLKRAH